MCTKFDQKYKKKLNEKKEKEKEKEEKRRETQSSHAQGFILFPFTDIGKQGMATQKVTRLPCSIVDNHFWVGVFNNVVK